MPTSNRIILTDVDGVLLEWEHHFTKWMLQRTLFDERGARYHPHRLLPDKENTYEMAERFGVTTDEIRKHIREFNSFDFFKIAKTDFLSFLWPLHFTSAVKLETI